VTIPFHGRRRFAIFTEISKVNLSKRTHQVSEFILSVSVT